MTDLFTRGELRDYLIKRVESCLQQLESMPEDELLSRSTDDIVVQLVRSAHIGPLEIGTDAIAGGVTEIKVNHYDPFQGRQYSVPGLRIHAVFEYAGSTDLFYYAPSTRLLTRFDAKIGNGTITVQVEQSGSIPNPIATKQAIDREIGQILTMTSHALVDVSAFEKSLDGRFRPAVERRKKFLQERRDLAGALGFQNS